MPLSLLAQVDLGDVAASGLQVAGGRGLLQVFIADDPEYGVDFDNLTQGRCVVLHHPHGGDDDWVRAVEPPNPDVNLFPARGVINLMCVDVATMLPTRSDYRCPSEVREAIEAAGNESDEEPEGWHIGGHRIGGYPDFVQFDPRSPVVDPAGRLARYDTLLLQLDPVAFPPTGVPDVEIMFGDMGTCQLLINEHALAAGDFSDLLWHWDCC